MPRKILLKSINCLCFELFSRIFFEWYYHKSSCRLPMGKYLYQYFFFSLYIAFTNILFGLVSLVWTLKAKMTINTALFPWPARVHSHAPSIRSHRGIKVVWPDFQPMRVPEEPVCVHLFRQKPVFTSLHLKSPVLGHRLRKIPGNFIDHAFEEI